MGEHEVDDAPPEHRLHGRFAGEGKRAQLVADLVSLEVDAPQLADATLVYLADRDGIDTIFTLDQRDFSVYRSARRRPFRIIPGAPGR